MEKELSKLLSPPDIKDFDTDTNLLAIQSGNFIESFYPSYLSTNMAISNIMNNADDDKLKNMTFYKITECCIDNVDDVFEFFSTKFQKLFTTAYSINQPVCYGVVSYHGSISLVLGVAPAVNDEREIITKIVEGLLPGIKLTKFNNGFINEQQEKQQDEVVSYDKDRYVGCISGIPMLKNKDHYLKKDIASLIRSLNGSNYTFLVMAKPVDNKDIQDKINKAIDIKDKCFQISKRTLSLQNSIGNTTTGTQSYSYTKGNSNSIGVSLLGLISNNRSKSTSETNSYSKAVSESINKSGSIALDVQNGYALELMKMADTMIERLKIGRNIGMWNMVVSYSSDSKMVRDIIQGSLYSEISSDNPDILPPVTFSCQDSCMSNGHIKKSSLNHIPIPSGIIDNENFLDKSMSSFVTSEELCGICTIPTENIPNFEIKQIKSYPLINPDNNNSLNDIELGTVCEYDRELSNIKFTMSEADIVKHTFVCGITGSGKTTTVKRILKECDKPFLVIEPAKKEYRNIGKENLSVYTLGRPEINSFRFNPFYILPGISPQQHIDFLKDLFNASFSFYGPMPYILEKCLCNIYTKKGWNLTLGFHPSLVDGDHIDEMFGLSTIKRRYSLKSHVFLFPTMQDLKNEVDNYIENEMTYEGEVKGNIQSAIKARIDSLCVGTKGYMFNTTSITNIENLLSHNAVFELEGLADDSDKAFALGLLIILINEYRQVQKEINLRDDMGLQHILVIEEAHRLLKNISNSYNENIGNPEGKAVEHFTNLLAEMRSYGQGVIVAEQIPSKLASDVIKNSSNKIIHRIVAYDDQQIIANTIGIKLEDANCLGTNKTGRALCHKEGMSLPVLVKIDSMNESKISDGKLYRHNLEQKFQDINKSIIHNAVSNEISKCSIRLLNSILLDQDTDIIDKGLDKCIEKIQEILRLQAVGVLPHIKTDESIRLCIFDETVKLLVNGIYSNDKLPKNELLDGLEKYINLPTEKNRSILLKILEDRFKPISMKEVALINISNLLCREFILGNDIKSDVQKFLLEESLQIANNVEEKLERKTRNVRINKSY